MAVSLALSARGVVLLGRAADASCMRRDGAWGLSGWRSPAGREEHHPEEPRMDG
jgi:hypothetical protein